MCVYVCLCPWVCEHACTGACMRAGRLSFLKCCPPFLSQCLLMTWSSPRGLGWLPSEAQESSCLSFLSTESPWVQGNLNSGPMLARQAFHLLRHLPVPSDRPREQFLCFVYTQACACPSGLWGHTLSLFKLTYLQGFLSCKGLRTSSYQFLLLPSIKRCSSGGCGDSSFGNLLAFQV